MDRIQFVKVWEGTDEAAPYYIQWVVWCWRKPIWIGLPLVWLAIPILGVDVIYGLVEVAILLMKWARR